MRATAPAMLLALLLLAPALLPPGGAQAPPPPAGPLLEDPQGDTRQEIDVADLGAPPLPQQLVPEADLVSLALTEADDVFTLVVRVAMLEGDLVSSRFFVPFTWNGQGYRAMMAYVAGQPTGPDRAWGNLQAERDDGWEWVASLTPVVDRPKGIISLAVPKAYVMDRDGRIPGRGDALVDLRVDSESFPLNVFMARTATRDHMPDDEAKAATYAFTMGDFATGTLRLGAPERVRVSNGGSTTFVFHATLENRADAEAEYALAIADLPEGWNASVQTPVKVPAKEEKTVTVLASVPFAHDHGGFTAFNLTVESTRDPATKGRLRLGVLHTPIPQPAGHHNELWLHAMGRNANPINALVEHVEPYGSGYLNTVADRDPSEAPHATPNDWNDDGPGWWIPLSPGLRMGLDFDLDKTGVLAGAFQGGIGDATLNAELILIRSQDGEDSVLLADAEPVKLTLDPDAKAPFSLTIVPTEDADYVPHQPGQNLVLRLRLDTETDLGGLPRARPLLATSDFKLALPLDEYHDRLTGLAETVAAALDLKAESPVEKVGRPGTLMTYVFTLAHLGTTPARYEIDLAGTDARHGHLVPRGIVELEPGATARLTLGVSIPPDAATGEELEVLLFVHDVDDPEKTAVARTKTTVSLGPDAAPDESPIYIAAREETRPTPGPAALALLGALALAAALAAALPATLATRGPHGPRRP